MLKASYKIDVPIAIRKLILFSFFVLTSQFSFAQKNYTQYVNPFIGTGGHAHTFPGACYPFGMMQLSPDTRVEGWDGCSGYYYADTIIYGFSHTHLSGTGCSDYGDILIMPLSKVPVGNHGIPATIGDFSSPFSHKDETATAGYYSVKLKNGDIKVDLTVGQYAGIHRYVFTKDDNCRIIVDLKHRDQVLSSELKWVSDTEVCGYRESRAWAKDQWIYFDIRFSKPVINKQLFRNDTAVNFISDVKSKNTKMLFGFKHSDTILVKVGISGVSEENARENLVHDIPGWDFNGTLKKTQKAWNDYLKKIEVSSKDKDLLTTFYTALYHTGIHPSLYTDVNGEYRGRDNKTHTASGFNMYTIFSLWDTYRALHPLYTIIDSSKDRQFILTFLKQYEQGGMLPVWELSANETNCMIAYHSVSVIYDAYQKGIRGFDANEALQAMEHSADANVRGLPALRQYGYIPADKSSESVSQTLECGYDDWCVAEMADALGKKDDYKKYIQLAQGYMDVFNPNNGFMQGRENGRFFVPFDPREVNFNYTEANGWQYSFYVPQDMNGFIALHGGKENLARKLDTMFTTTSVMTGRQQPDITGMIGQYAQGNEPSHHIAYLYDYVGQPWKTAEYVHKIEKFYTNTPDGICGNDDCGALSAWYVMSAMGMYQVCPGDGQFELTTPLFDTVKIHLENGKTFTITAYDWEHSSGDVESATLNGSDYKNSFLRYTDLMSGGTLSYKFTLTNLLSDWGTSGNVPRTYILEADRTWPQPYFEYGNATFTDSMKITAKQYGSNDSIYILFKYIDSIGNSMIASEPYKGPYYIHESWMLDLAVAKNGKELNKLFSDGFSNTLDFINFTKIPKGRTIKVLSKPNSQYTAGGPGALIDYQHGSADFRLGAWQGYQYQDFEAVVDLGKIETVHEVNAEFLEDAMSWIFMPTYVDFSVSTDSIHFTPVAHVDNTLPDTTLVPTIETLGKKIPEQKVRYVKVFAKNYGKLPKWHLGYGDDAFIFIDEIEIK